MNEPNEDGEVVSIITMADGEAIRQIDEALSDVWENIADVNTEAKAKRVVTLRVTFEPDTEREVVVVGLVVEKKLAGAAGAASKILLGYQGGQVVASEYRSRQTTIEDHVENVLRLEKGDER